MSCVSSSVRLYIQDAKASQIPQSEDSGTERDAVCQPEVSQGLESDPCDSAAWGTGSQYEDLLLVRPDEPRDEDEFMSQTVVNTSVLYRVIQKLLLEAEGAAAENKYGAAHSVLNYLGGVLWVVKELKYLTPEELKPYFAQMRKLRNEAILYESQGV